MTRNKTLNEYSLERWGRHFIQLSPLDQKTTYTAWKALSDFNFGDIFAGNPFNNIF